MRLGQDTGNVGIHQKLSKPVMYASYLKEGTNLQAHWKTGTFSNVVGHSWMDIE